MAKLLPIAALFFVVAVAAAAATALSGRQQTAGLSLLCPVCQDEAPAVLASLGANATDSEIAAALGRLCALLPAGSTLRGECASAVADVVAALADGSGSVLSKYSGNALCSAFSLCVNECCESPAQPEQIHVAVGAGGAVRVSWATLEPTATLVQWSDAPVVSNYATDWPAGGYAQANGSRLTFSSGGWRGWLHTAEVPAAALQADTAYWYRVGDPAAHNLWHRGWSVPQLRFRTPPVGTARAVRFAAYADAGADDVFDPVVRRLLPLAAAGQLDAVLHYGDISYADGFEMLGDDFMRKIEPLAAYVPYMTTPGNHEDFFNFAPYKARLGSIMPWADSNSTSPLWYSFDYGPAHVVALSTEGNFGSLGDLQPGSPQYQWLAADLAAANARRPLVPWLVVMAHRPFYCSNRGPGPACTSEAAIFRSEAEQLLQQAGVDLVLTGHSHAYERSLPVFQGAAVQQDYRQPTAPVYILNGAAGNKEQLEMSWSDPQPAWSAARMSIYGFGLLTIHNATALTWDFVAANNGTVVDSFTMTK